MPPSSFIKAHRAVGSSRILATFAGIDRPVLLVNTDQNMVCTCYLLSTIYYRLTGTLKPVSSSTPRTASNPSSVLGGCFVPHTIAPALESF